MITWEFFELKFILFLSIYRHFPITENIYRLYFFSVEVLDILGLDLDFFVISDLCLNQTSVRITEKNTECNGKNYQIVRENIKRMIQNNYL